MLVIGRIPPRTTDAYMLPSRARNEADRFEKCYVDLFSAIYFSVGKFTFCRIYLAKLRVL